MLPVLTNFLPLTAFGFVTAVIAIAYYRFTQPGEVLAWWAKILKRLYDYVLAETNTAITWPDNHVRYQWVLKPVLTCETCIASQVAFWLFLWLLPFDLLSLLYVVALASFVAPIALKLLHS